MIADIFSTFVIIGAEVIVLGLVTGRRHINFCRTRKGEGQTGPNRSVLVHVALSDTTIKMQRETELERRQRRYARETAWEEQKESIRQKKQREAQENAERKAEKRRQKQEENRAAAAAAEKEKLKKAPPPPVLSGRAAHLATLGITQDTPDAIRAAYRRMALRYHPDKNPAANAAELFRRVKMAYDALLAT